MSLHTSVQLQMPQVFMLHMSCLNCTTFFASVITIITNQRGKAFPVCVCVCWFAEGTFLSRPGRKWEAPGGERDCKTEFPERFEEGTTGKQRPLFVTRALLVPQGPYGPLPLCTLTSAHSSPSTTPLSTSVTGPSTWMSHGRSEVAPGSLQFDSVFHLLFSFLHSLSPSHTTLNICVYVRCLLLVSLCFSLSFWGILDTVLKPGNRQLPPVLCSDSPLLLSLRPLFWQGTGCQLWL